MALVPSGKQWPDNLPSGGSSVTPLEFDYTTAAFSMTPAEVKDFSIVIPSNRLYGISVYVLGLTVSQSCFVQMFGDSAISEVQYSANFNSTANADTAQAWRYRSRAEDKILHLRVTNTSTVALTNIQISFKVEPF